MSPRMWVCPSVPKSNRKYIKENSKCWYWPFFIKSKNADLRICSSKIVLNYGCTVHIYMCAFQWNFSPSYGPIRPNVTLSMDFHFSPPLHDQVYVIHMIIHSQPCPLRPTMDLYSPWDVSSISNLFAAFSNKAHQWPMLTSMNLSVCLPYDLPFSILSTKAYYGPLWSLGCIVHCQLVCNLVQLGPPWNIT